MESFGEVGEVGEVGEGKLAWWSTNREICSFVRILAMIYFLEKKKQIRYFRDGVKYSGWSWKDMA